MIPSSESLVNTKDNIGQTWEHSVVLRLPRPIYVAALFIAICICAAYVSFQLFFGFRIETSAFGLIVFLVALLVAPVFFFGSSDHQSYEVQSFSIAREIVKNSRFAGVAGMLAFVGLWEVIQVSQGREFLSLWTRLHPGTSITVMFLWIGWLAGRSGYFLSAGIWDTPGLQESDIDVLNLEKLYVIGRGGLEGAFGWFITIAIAAFLILPEAGSGLWVVVPIFVINAGVGLAFLIVPARKVRNLIRDVKREELARLEPLVVQARDDTLSDASAHGRLSDLLAYRNQVEATAEWPFDSSTLLRFGLYLLIPIGSMVGGALVERVVNWVLD